MPEIVQSNRPRFGNTFPLDVVGCLKEPAEGERPVAATSNSNLLVIPSHFSHPKA